MYLSGSSRTVIDLVTSGGELRRRRVPSRWQHPISSAFNDEFGHDAGDSAQRQAATLLAESLRTSDVVSRVRGEEFLLILPGASIHAALQKCDKMREKMKSRELHRGRRMPQLMFSAGAAAFPANGDTPEALPRAADAALYEAKHAGRDRALAAQDPTPR